jgi:hypothetical protein
VSEGGKKREGEREGGIRQKVVDNARSGEINER